MYGTQIEEGFFPHPSTICFAHSFIVCGCSRYSNLFIYAIFILPQSTVGLEGTLQEPGHLVILEGFSSYPITIMVKVLDPFP
jgi:hypothetical protein